MLVSFSKESCDLEAALRSQGEENSARRYRILRRLWATFENETFRCDLASWNYRGALMILKWLSACIGSPHNCLCKEFRSYRLVSNCRSTF